MGEEKEVIKRRGLVKKHAVVDYEVWQWKTNLEQTRKQRVTKTEVQAFAIEAYRRVGIENFKASDGWYRRWRVRWTQPDIIKTKDLKVKGKNSQDLKKDSVNNVKIAISEGNHKTRTKPTPSQQVSKKKIKEIKENQTEGTGQHLNLMNNDAEAAYLDNKFDWSSVLTSEDQFKDKQDCELDHNSFLNVIGLARVQEKNQKQNDPLIATKPALSNIVTRTDQNPVQSVVSIDCNDTLLAGEHVRFGFVEGEKVGNKEIQFTPKTMVSDIPSVVSIANEEAVMFEVENMEENSSSNVNIQKITNDQDDDIERDALWTFETSQNMQLSNTQKETITSSQSDSGISIPFSISSLDTSYSITSPLFHETNLEFCDVDIYCDSCEDFHPRHKGLYSHCCKERNKLDNSSFFSCVFEKKDLGSTIDPGLSTIPEEVAVGVGRLVEEEDARYRSSNVVLPKGKRYLLQFKSKVVNYALSHSVKEAINKFKVNRGTVSEWLAERKRLSGCGSTRTSKFKETTLVDDSEFLVWLEGSKFNLTNELIKQKTSEWLLSSGEGNRKSNWLRMYAHRLNGTEDSSSRKRYIAYPDMFKRIAVFHAQTHSNMAAARVFGVARRRIVNWLDVSRESKHEANVSCAKNVTDEAVDRQVFEWYQSQESPPSAKQIRCKAVELYQAAGYLSIKCGPHWYYRWRARHKLPPASSQLYDDLSLLTWALTQLDNNQLVTHTTLAAHAQNKVSRGWTFRFCRKHHKLLQRLPDATAALPPALERLVAGYRLSVHSTLTACGYHLPNILALDEVPLNFLSKDENKTPSLIRRPGFESCQASLMVSSMADGTLLPALFVFKGVAPTCKSDPRVISAVSETGQVKEDIMLQWLNRICFSHLREGGVLVTDCFDVHTAKEVQQAMVEHRVHHAVIPGGCGFKLLPVLSLCQMYKKMVEELWHVSLASQLARLCPPSPDQLYLWAVRVHKHLAKQQRENIQTAFKEMLLQTSSQDPSST